MQCKVETPENAIEGKARSAFSQMVIWLLLNGAMTACAVYGLFLHADHAKNVLLFFVWSSSVIVTLGGMREETKLKLRTNGRAVPRWLSIGNDLFIMVALASVGRFFSAGAMLWQILCEANIYDNKD